MDSSHLLIERVAAQIEPLLPAHNSILIGLSGGVDSVVLLHLLYKIAPRFSWRLSALHVHHGISPNADAWADFCADLCARHQIPLHIEHVDIAPLREHGIEAAARKLRHEAFAAQACDFVALAHHADDQAETLLLQLLRGAGVRGAAAMTVLMKPLAIRPGYQSENFWPGTRKMIAGSLVMSQSKRAMHAGRTGSSGLLRPLLDCSRQEIMAYATEQGLQWIEDESNADDSYPRNFLRHRILPLLEQRFPTYRDTLARSARHFADASKLLDELAQQDAQNPLPSPSGISSDLAVGFGQPSQMASSSTSGFISGAGGEGDEFRLEILRLQSLSQPRAKNLLRYFLHERGATMPQAVQLDDMLRQLCSARADAAVCIAFGEWQVRRFQGNVYLLRALGGFDPGLVLSWHGEAELEWPALNTRLRFNHAQAGISLEKLQRAAVTLRLRRGGETLRPQLKAATRTLKNLLQELHIPPWQRDRLPLLYCGDELVCVPGVAVAAGYRADGHEAALQVELEGARIGKA